MKTTPSSHILKEFQPKLRNSLMWLRGDYGLILIALVLGGSATALQKKTSNTQYKKTFDKFAEIDVYRAASPIKSGEIISAAKLKTGKILSENLSKNHVTTDKLHLAVGRQSLIDLKPGNIILLTALKESGSSKELAAKIPHGRRLFNLKITSKVAKYGFVKPNDHIDILATLDLPKRGPTTFTILQNVTVVSVGANSNDHRGKPSAQDISFFTKPKNLEILSFAQKHGLFSIVLRNPHDGTKLPLGKGIDLNAFLDSHLINNASGGGALKVTEKGKVISRER